MRGAVPALLASLIALAAAGAPEAPSPVEGAADPWEAILDEPLPIGWPPSERPLHEFLRGLAAAARGIARDASLRIEIDAGADWALDRVIVSPDGPPDAFRAATIREALELLPRAGLGAVRDGAALRVVPASAEAIARGAAGAEALPYDRREAKRLRLEDRRDPEAAIAAKGKASAAAIRALGSALGGDSAADALDRIREALGAGASLGDVAAALAALAGTCGGGGEGRAGEPSAAGLEREIREALVAAAGSRDPAARAAGLWAAAAWHRAPGVAIPALLHGAADGDAGIRRAAFAALAALPHRSVAAEAVARERVASLALGEKDPAARAEAFAAAGNFHDALPADLLAALREALAGKDATLRAGAARGLAAGPAALGDARSGLLQGLASDPDPAVREAAQRGLLPFAAGGDETAIGVLVHRAKDASAPRAERARLLREMARWGLRNSMPDQFAVAHFQAFSGKEEAALRPLWARLYLEMDSRVQRRMDPDRFRALAARAPDPLVRREALRWAAARGLSVPRDRRAAYAEAIEGAARPISQDGWALAAVAALRGREAAAGFARSVRDRIPAPSPAAPPDLEDACALAALAGAFRRMGGSDAAVPPDGPLARIAAVAEGSKRMPADERELALACIRGDGRAVASPPRSDAGASGASGEAELRAALGAGGPAARAAMRRVLAMPPEAAAPILADARASPDARVRRRIAERIPGLFAPLPEARRGPFLAETVPLLSDADPVARRAAAAGLFRIAAGIEPGKDACLGTLAAALRTVRDRVPMDSPDVVRLLRELRDAPLAETLAVRGLSSPDPEARAAALDALESILEDGERRLLRDSKPAAEALSAVLLDERATDEVRARAGVLLARSRNPDGVSAAQAFSKGRRKAEQDIRQAIRDALEADEEEERKGN